MLIALLIAVAIAATPQTPPDTLTDRAITIALDTVCSPRRAGGRAAVPGCKRDHRARVRRDAAAIIDACRSAEPAPRDVVCLALVATAAGESSLRARPSCGAPDECRESCLADHRCLVRCAIDHGVTGRKLKRVLGCNDGGTSAGWYQIKRRGGIRVLCETAWGRRVDLHDLDDATACYALAVAESVRMNKCRERDPWPSAFARVAAGPWRYVHRGDGTKRRERRCGANRYFARAEAAWHVEAVSVADDYPRAVVIDGDITRGLP